MKFGKNLAHLSIPEWKDYNLDYNDLKASIRDVTNSPDSDLSHLYHKFLENFDYLNLFVTTKTGEIARKLKFSLKEFHVVQYSEDSNAVKLAKLSRLQFQIMNDISTELRKLTKFILMQKIAVKKIFKKFAKHYPDEIRSKKFISSLTHVLLSNSNSFLNFDLTKITSQLLALLEDIDAELKLLHELLHTKHIFHPLVHGNLQKVKSTATIKTARSSIVSATSSPDNAHIDVNVGNHIDHAAKFDLITKIKKNFVLLAIVPKDIISKNDLSLSMDVYLNIPKMSDSSRICITYFTENPEDETPSYVISYEHSTMSVVVAYTGGLRKYSYSCLPNSVVESIFAVCRIRDALQKQKLKADFLELVYSKSLPAMAKLTISSLLNNDHTPSLKFVCDRTRYFVHKDLTQSNDSNDIHESISASPLESIMGSDSKATSTVDTKVYEDSYYMTFDENIYTTNSIGDRITFGTDTLDSFPFSMFNIHSNDSNLHNFETTLSTTIEGNAVVSKYKEITLKKMPVKIQNLLRNSTVQLVKNLCVYDYMRSCYFNIIPGEQNNHYSRLLSINVLKNLENVEMVNHQTTVDQHIIQDKSRSLLKRQMSCKSLQESLGITPPLVEQHSIVESVASERSALKDHQFFDYRPYDDTQLVYLQKYNDLENLDDDDDEDSYFVYLSFNNDLDDNVLNSLLLSFIKFKHRIRRAFRAFNLHANGPSLWKTYKEKLGDHVLNYDSINEDPTFFNSANDYQIQLVYDYDHVLSVVYFTLCFSGLFISGINLGIVYGLLRLQQENRDVDVINNPLMVFMLIFGYLLSLLFSMASINLNYHRFKATPPAHSGIIWAGFLMVTATVVWTVVAIFT